ncbi:hypothetical protein [Arthrobacter sp.]|uniref:hypothetical protein n=1 Tax=Arthrobacter sp. TaxID=1667 RepID=UPI003A9311DE
MTVEQWGPWAAAALGLVNLVAGIQAYRGRYRAWLVLKGSIAPGWPGLASLYLGVFFVLISISGWILERGAAVLDFMVFVFAVPSLVVGIIAMFWLPSFMLPTWVKETRRKIRSGEDRLSRDLAPGGALYGRLGVDTEDQPRTPPDGEAADEDGKGQRR